MLDAEMPLRIIRSNRYNHQVSCLVSLRWINLVDGKKQTVVATFRFHDLSVKASFQQDQEPKSLSHRKICPNSPHFDDTVE